MLQKGQKWFINTNMDKNNLRKKYKNLRDALSSDLKKIYDQKILENFSGLDLKLYQNFFIYYNFKNEADTKAIIKMLLKLEKNVYLPKTEKDKMFFIKYSGQALIKNNFGIYEPTGDYTEDIPDICVIPLLATDYSGNRIGYGGGYYDKFLRDKKCLKAGLLYSFQITDNLPINKLDIPMDILITENKVIRIKQNG